MFLKNASRIKLARAIFEKRRVSMERLRWSRRHHLPGEIVRNQVSRAENNLSYHHSHHWKFSSNRFHPFGLINVAPLSRIHNVDYGVTRILREDDRARVNRLASATRRWEGWLTPRSKQHCPPDSGLAASCCHFFFIWPLLARACPWVSLSGPVLVHASRSEPKLIKRGRSVARGQAPSSSRPPSLCRRALFLDQNIK